MGFWGDRWENVHFYSKPRHVTPQINHLGKMSPVLRVSTHIYGVSKDIGGKTFIFQLNLGMWPLKSIVLEKMSTVLRVSIHIYGVFKEIVVKNGNFILVLTSSCPRMAMSNFYSHVVVKNGNFTLLLISSGPEW